MSCSAPSSPPKNNHSPVKEDTNVIPDFTTSMTAFKAGSRRQELAQLYQTAQMTQNVLATLYARRCLLSLLYKLKDQIQTDEQQQVESKDEKTAPPPMFPPFLRRTASLDHALSSFGPVGFLAKFIALLCSNPQQLTLPDPLQTRGSVGLDTLKEILHTILYAEQQQLQQEAMELQSRIVPFHRFKQSAPIARNLLQDAALHMLSLCRADQTSELHHVMLCYVLSCDVMSGHVFSCHVILLHAMS